MMTSRVFNKLSAMGLLVSTIALGGCETLGNPMDVLTGKRNAPDEFLVVARKPLRMPGSLALPEPRLGEPSPLEPDPNTAAVIALLGSPTVAPATSGGSAGEQALLSAANASGSNLPQRDLELQEIERQRLENQPYEAPLLVDLVSGQSDIEDYEDALVPQAEARRLQVEGLAPAPIDPQDRPSQEPPERSAGDEELLGQRPPKNRLPNAPTETAF